MQEIFKKYFMLYLVKVWLKELYTRFLRGSVYAILKKIYIR